MEHWQSGLEEKNPPGVIYCTQNNVDVRLRSREKNETSTSVTRGGLGKKSRGIISSASASSSARGSAVVFFEEQKNARTVVESAPTGSDRQNFFN
jgi:hypothetical protein